MTSWIITWPDGVQNFGNNASEVLDHLSQNQWIAHWESLGHGDVKAQLAERARIDQDLNDQDFLIRLAEVGAITLMIVR